MSNLSPTKTNDYMEYGMHVCKHDMLWKKAILHLEQRPQPVIASYVFL